MISGAADDAGVPDIVDRTRKIEFQRPIIQCRAGIIFDGDLPVETAAPIGGGQVLHAAGGLARSPLAEDTERTNDTNRE